MFNSNYPSNQKLLTLTSVNINGTALNIDTSVNFRNALFYLNSNNRIGILNTTPQYTLDIGGDINLTGNIYKDGQMILTEFADVSLWSSLPGYIFYNGGSVGIGTTENPSAYLFYVNGTSYFLSTVTLDGNLDVNATIMCDDIIVSDTATITNLNVTGTTSLNGLVSTGLINTNGLTVTSGDINVTSGNINAPGSTITCLNCYVTNQSTFASNVTFEENVTVLGKLNCLDNFNVNNKLTIYAPSGNIVTNGSVSIGNSVSVGSSLEVSGYSEFYKATVNNDLNINGNLYVGTGSTNLHDLTVVDTTNLNGNVSIDSKNVTVDTTSQNVTIGYSTISSSVTTGALVIKGGVGIGVNLNVAGPIISGSGTSKFLDLTVTNDLNVNGLTSLYSGAKIFGDNYIYGDLYVESESSYGGTINGVNLNIGNLSSSLVSALTIDSSGNLNTIGNIELDQNLTVGGNVIIEGNLTLSGTTSSFAGGIITNSRFIQDTLATYSVYPTYSGSTFIIISHSILNTIYLPSTNTIGTYYKFVVGPGYTSVGNTINIQINLSTPIITMFGLIDNASTYTSISSANILTFNSNAPGDFVELSVVSTSSTGNYAYYINAKSSNSNGFLFS